MTKALEFVKNKTHLAFCPASYLSEKSGKCICGRDEAIQQLSKASEDTAMLDLLEELDGDELEAICQGRTFRESLRQAMKGNKG